MRKNTVLLIGVTVALASCWPFTRPSSPDPSIWVSEERHDFGNITPDKTVEYVFNIKNTGAKDLDIERVQTSCGCTAAVMDTQKLKPGEKSRLKATFDPRGRHGSQTRIIWIYSNDPKNRQKQITITANVQEPNVFGTPPPVVQGYPMPQAGSETGQTPGQPAAPATPGAAPAAPAANPAPAPAAPAAQPAPAPQAQPAAPTPAPKPAAK